MDYRLGRLKGQFVVVWEEGGRRRRFRLGALTPAEARAALREFIAGRSLRSGQARQTIEAIWNDYVAEKQAEGKVSVARMRDAWKRLAPHFAHLVPDDCSSSVVRTYTASRRAQRASDGTIHVELGYLRAALRHTLKGRAPDIKLPSKPRPRTRHLTTDEAKRLIDAAQMPHVRLFIHLALRTAGRPSSILDLEWDRVDFERGRIFLDNPHRDRTAKGRANPPMAAELKPLLLQAKQAALTNYVIEWAGKPVKSIKRAIQRTAARAGLAGVTPYVLRHTAARWLVESGIPIETVAQYMGHTNPSVTFRVYGRMSPDYLRDASDAISRKLNETSSKLPAVLHHRGRPDLEERPPNQESPEQQGLPDSDPKRGGEDLS